MTFKNFKLLFLVLSFSTLAPQMSFGCPMLSAAISRMTASINMPDFKDNVYDDLQHIRNALQNCFADYGKVLSADKIAKMNGLVENFEIGQMLNVFYQDPTEKNKTSLLGLLYELDARFKTMCE